MHLTLNRKIVGWLNWLTRATEERNVAGSTPLWALIFAYPHAHVWGMKMGILAGIGNSPSPLQP
jgi:hypothetical protein